MKKLFVALGVLGAVALLVYWQMADKKALAERNALAAEFVTKISKDWSPALMRDLADPGLIRAMASQGQSAEQLFEIYSKLGRLAEPVQCTFKNDGTFTKNSELVTSHSFECEAAYENAPAQISITLNKAEHDDQWKIYYIRIHSEIFGRTTE